MSKYCTPSLQWGVNLARTFYFLVFFYINQHSEVTVAAYVGRLVVSWLVGGLECGLNCGWGRGWTRGRLGGGWGRGPAWGGVVDGDVTETESRRRGSCDPTPKLATVLDRGC